MGQKKVSKSPRMGNWTKDQPPFCSSESLGRCSVSPHPARRWSGSLHVAAIAPPSSHCFKISRGRIQRARSTLNNRRILQQLRNVVLNHFRNLKRWTLLRHLRPHMMAMKKQLFCQLGEKEGKLQWQIPSLPLLRLLIPILFFFFWRKAWQNAASLPNEDANVAHTHTHIQGLKGVVLGSLISREAVQAPAPSTPATGDLCGAPGQSILIRFEKILNQSFNKLLKFFFQHGSVTRERATAH